jgi:diphthamide synthase subunit DPH2
LDEVEALLLKDVEKILKSLSAQETGLIVCSEDGRRNENVTRRCIKRIVMNRLQKLGYNAAICRSRWDHSGGLSAGIITV